MLSSRLGNQLWTLICQNVYNLLYTLSMTIIITLISNTDKLMVVEEVCHHIKDRWIYPRFKLTVLLSSSSIISFMKYHPQVIWIILQRIWINQEHLKETTSINCTPIMIMNRISELFKVKLANTKRIPLHLTSRWTYRIITIKITAKCTFPQPLKKQH